MPVMDGFQLCRLVRENELLKEIPFVFYTATYTDKRDEQFALMLGANSFIRKPIATDKFIQLIINVLKEAKAGKIEFKSDKQAGIHVGVGKRSFEKEKLSENIKHVVEAINHAKPATIKGNLIKTATLSTTMGPGLRIAL